MTIANNLGKTIQGRPKSTSERNTPKTMMSGSLGSWSSRLVCSCPLPAFLVICLLLFKLCSFRRHGHFQFRFSFLPYFTLNTVSWIAVITPMGSMDRPFVFRLSFFRCISLLFRKWSGCCAYYFLTNIVECEFISHSEDLYLCRCVESTQAFYFRLPKNL